MQSGFSKEQRLCSRRIINGLVSDGRVLFKYPFKVYYKPGDKMLPRYVISVPKKSFKRAVWRNTLKRRTREALRLNQAAALEGFCADYLFVYVAREECSFAEIQAAVVDILTRSAEQTISDHPSAAGTGVTGIHADSERPQAEKRPGIQMADSGEQANAEKRPGIQMADSGEQANAEKQ